MEGVIDKTRLIWPQLAALYESIAPYSYALIRFGAGAIIFYHGFAKLFRGLAPAVADGFASMGFPIPEALAYGLGILATPTMATSTIYTFFTFPQTVDDVVSSVRLRTQTVLGGIAY